MSENCGQPTFFTKHGLAWFKSGVPGSIYSLKSGRIWQVRSIVILLWRRH